MAPVATLLTELTAELALFAAAGFLIFAIDDLFVDLAFFIRFGWRSLVVYTRFPRTYAGNLSRPTIKRRTAIITEQGSFLRTGDKLVPMPRGIERGAIE